MRECTALGCPNEVISRGHCAAHYQATRLAGDLPGCKCGTDLNGWCDTHHPPVCVCARPDLTDGVCRRCQRLHTPANPDLRPLADEARATWRAWLCCEGVLGHVEAARARTLETS